MPDHIFISHATADDAFVKIFRQKLEGNGFSTWVDSRAMRPGNVLEDTINKAIDEARGFMVVLSPQTINSWWVRKEVKRALQVQANNPDYAVIPILLPDVKPSALGIWFGDNVPVAIIVETATQLGLDEKWGDVLAGLEDALPDDATPYEPIAHAPLDMLRLRLFNPTMHVDEKEGTRRARANAQIVFKSADPNITQSESDLFTFTAPVGVIEKDELRWYLEAYPQFLSKIVIDDRAKKVESSLSVWGKMLYDALFTDETAKDAFNVWQHRSQNDLRFSVEVRLPKSDAKTDEETNKATAHLLTIPWELLHNEDGFLIHGKQTVRVRRHIPAPKTRERQQATLPIRILLVSPRPEVREDGTGRIGYIDHRASARPMVEAVEELGALAELTLLQPPTFGALDDALREASEAGAPYHVVHIDGHGVFDKRVGLGALCFEDARDEAQIMKRRVEMISADKLAGRLRGYGVPLVFLDACQTATSDALPNASVAARLLEQGVTSVVAMSHSVLVETARRFVKQFYQTLAAGQTVSAAMVAGQRALKNDTLRGKKRGEDLRLHDWFVPVLYQEQTDPHLFTQIAPERIKQLARQAQERAFGDLPATPSHTFIGRGRELLALERLLIQKTPAKLSYIVIRGTGGAGKTTIASELARWFVRSKRCERVAFVSLEQHTNADTILYQIGKQLLPDVNTVTLEGLPAVERALRDRGTVIVLDNVETVLGMKSSPPPGSSRIPSPSPSRGEGDFLDEIWELCARLLRADKRTRIIFTSRERLPAPFDHAGRDVPLGALSVNDAIGLVERVMSDAGWQPAPTDGGRTPDEVVALVTAVNRHARALVLLAREVAVQGVNATTADLTQIMAALERKHPGDRENSLYASVALSLRRLTDEAREKLAQLAVVHGGGQEFILRTVMGVDQEEVANLGRALIAVGLATEERYGYLRLDPALPAYWEQTLPSSALPPLRQRWADGMIQLVDFLYQQKFQDTEMAHQLTLLELPNLVALLRQLKIEIETGDREGRADDVARTARYIEQLVANLGQPAVLALAVDVRETAANQIGAWSEALFQNEAMTIERLLGQGNVPAAYQAAVALHEKAGTAGESAYTGADYDIAMAHNLVGQVLSGAGQAAQALPYYKEAQNRFESIVALRESSSAEQMASVVLTRQADCLSALGQLDAAGQLYERAIALGKARGDERGVGVAQGQLGTVRMLQERYADALTIYAEARERFEELGEAQSVAKIWHQTGMVYKREERYEQAEDAYQKSYAIEMETGDLAGQAGSLVELGNLFYQMRRWEDAVVYYRKAADIYAALQDLRHEGLARSNIADTLVKLGRYDEARPEITRAIECKQPYGHVAESWKTWGILYRIEKATGNSAAADAAWAHARSAYLAYRRQGGYAQGGSGQLCDQLVADWDVGTRHVVSLQERDDLPAWMQTFLPKLAQVVNGGRNPALADDTALDYGSAAELLFLIERLEASDA